MTSDGLGPMMTHDDFVELVPAYALDVLDAVECGPFEAHLAGCATCRAELAVFRTTTVAIGMAIVPEAPPASLRARTLARATSQTPVIAAPARPMTGLASAASAPTPAPWMGWLAAAGVLISFGLGTYAWSLRAQLTDARAQLATTSARAESLRDQLARVRLDAARLINTVNVLGAPDVIKVNLKGLAEGAAASGHAYISASRGMVFDAEHMPVLSADKIYQLWVIPPGAKPVSAGVFRVDANGATSLQMTVPAGVQVAQTIAVTIEDGPTGVVQSVHGPVLAGSVGQ